MALSKGARGMPSFAACCVPLILFANGIASVATYNTLYYGHANASTPKPGRSQATKRNPALAVAVAAAPLSRLREKAAEREPLL